MGAGVAGVTAQSARDHSNVAVYTDPHIMARDALHAAVVMAEGLEAICSYDRDFDRIKGLVRTVPQS